MTIWTEEFQVLEAIVGSVAVFMLELKHDFLFLPHQYTITICEVLILACGTLINPIKITQKSFFDVIVVCILTVHYKNFVCWYLIINMICV